MKLGLVALAAAAGGALLLSKREPAAPPFGGVVGVGTGQNVQEVKGEKTFAKIVVQRVWTDGGSELANVVIPAWAHRAVVTLRVEVAGRRLELNNTKTHFVRCAGWTFFGQVSPGVTLNTNNRPAHGGFVPTAIPGCGDNGDDWATPRAFYNDKDAAGTLNPNERAMLDALPQPGTAWWLRARARITVDRRLVVEMTYPRDVVGAMDQDGGPFRGNKYDAALDYVLAR